MSSFVHWRVGCSGFSYKHWRGGFYPEKLAQSKWFSFYTGRFNALELNTTFYRFPRLGYVQKWYDNSPDNFLFSVKAPRAITHYKKFIDCQRYLGDVYNTLSQGLQHKLGAVLFQLPDTITYSQAFLDRIVNSLDKSFVNVVEFRHQSWWQQPVYDALAQNNIIFCGISHPDLPDQVVINHRLVYYRFHGVPQLYASQYTPYYLEQKASEIMKQHVEQAYILFNNDINMSAIYNGFEFKQLVGLPALL